MTPFWDFRSGSTVGDTMHAAIAGPHRMNVLVLRSSTELQQIDQARQAATSAFEEVSG